MKHFATLFLAHLVARRQHLPIKSTAIFVCSQWLLLAVNDNLVPTSVWAIILLFLSMVLETPFSFAFYGFDPDLKDHHSALPNVPLWKQFCVTLVGLGVALSYLALLAFPVWVYPFVMAFFSMVLLYQYWRSKRAKLQQP